MSSFPRKFGDYLLLGSLGQGGMGEVFLARVKGPAGIDRLCVVKMVRTDVDDDSYVTRFLDEARVMCQLNHGNIAHLTDVGESGGQFYLSMEHIFGVTLKDLAFDAEGRGEGFEVIAIYIAGEVLKGLDYAHRNKDPLTGAPRPVVHRDVSPQNVMVNVEGEVKIIDFGLAASTTKVEQTDQNTVMGKIAYMSPEQARGEDVDGRSDQFTAAILTYELLAGERFYDPKLPPHAIWGLSGSGGVFPKRFGELQDEVQAVLRKALSPRVGDRYPTCGAMRDALLATADPAKIREAPERLRRLLEQRFGPTLRARFEPLAAAADVPLPAPEAPVLASGPHEATETVPSSPSMPILVDDTSVTGEHSLAHRRSRRGAILAAALGAVVVAGALTFALWPEDEGPPVVAIPEAPAAPPVAAPAEAEASGVEASADGAAPQPSTTQPSTTERTVRLRSRPDGATVVVEGRGDFQCVTPCELQAREGEQVVARFSRVGYRSVRREARVGEGDLTLKAQLSRDARAVRRITPKPKRGEELKGKARIKSKNAVADPW